MPKHRIAPFKPGSHARKTPFLDDRVREKIQASMIVNALIDHVKGVNNMSSTQVRAALGLLAKVLPDLRALDVSGELQHRIAVVRDEPLSPEEFARLYCDPPQLIEN
jgi:hypothetical protein